MPRTIAGSRRLIRNFNSALTFTAGATFGQITTNSTLNTLGNGTNFWLYVEFRARRNTTGANFRIVGKNDSGVAKYPFAVRILGTGLLETIMYNGSGGAARLSNNRVDDGNWHRHLALFTQTSSTMTTYLDGVVNGSVSGNNSILGTDQSNTGDIFIGRRNGESPLMPGSVQTLAIGQGSPSAAEIANLNFNGVMPPTSTILVNIRHDNGSGNTATDLSGDGNNAALTSPVWTTDSFGKSRTLRP